MLSADAPEDTTEAWKQDLGDRMEEIIDRKRSSVQGREAALAQYVHMLMSHYSFEEVQHKTSELFPALLKSIKTESSEKETSLALRGWSNLGSSICIKILTATAAMVLTLITTPSEAIYDAIFQPLKRTYKHSKSNSVKAVAIHTLATAAIYGGASDSEIEEIMDDFLEIIES